MLSRSIFFPFISPSRMSLLTPSANHVRNNLFSSPVPSVLIRLHSSAITNAPLPWAIATVTSRPTVVRNDEANSDGEKQEWINRYDPVWCQFVPHYSKGGNDAVMNDLVYRQLVQRLIDQCLVSHFAFPYYFGNLLRLLPASTPSFHGMSRTALASGAISWSYLRQENWISIVTNCRRM